MVVIIFLINGYQTNLSELPKDRSFIYALIIGGLAGLWFQSTLLGATIALAIVVNIITAALFGVLIPIVLDKLKLDPALAGSVILTTVTDVVGFFAFLGTASLVLL